jgi:hypothetical protein
MCLVGCANEGASSEQGRTILSLMKTLLEVQAFAVLCTFEAGAYIVTSM